MLPTVTITPPVLPEPLPQDHQYLNDIFYAHWQSLNNIVIENNEENRDIEDPSKVEGMMRSPNQSEIAAVMPPKVNAAVILGNLQTQVDNGGFIQYVDNGYSDCIEAVRCLYQGAVSNDIENADKILKIVEEFIGIKEAEKDNCDFQNNDDFLDPYGHLDTQFYAIDNLKIMQEMLDKFEDISKNSFMNYAYKEHQD